MYAKAGRRRLHSLAHCEVAENIVPAKDDGVCLLSFTGDWMSDYEKKGL